MRIIGLTGGIASGKSTVSEELQRLGAAIVDADKVAWQLAEPHQHIWQAYVLRYGKSVINDDDSLNRQAVAERVFSNKDELKWMNEMAHPLIRAEMFRQIDDLRQKEKDGDNTVVILDVPLLFEGGWQSMTDETWLVYTSEQNQIARLKLRNGIEEAEARKRIASQMSLSEKKKLADFTISNNGTKDELLEKIRTLWEQRIVSIDIE